MANRSRYILLLSDRYVYVYLRGAERKLLGVLYRNGVSAKCKKSYRIPQYIKDECHNILNASIPELKRGYTNSGKPCKIG